MTDADSAWFCTLGSLHALGLHVKVAGVKTLAVQLSSATEGE